MDAVKELPLLETFRAAFTDLAAVYKTASRERARMNDGSWFHANRSTVKRSEGRNAVATAAYCSGTSLYDATERTTHDYSKKPGVVEAFVTTPTDKPGREWAHDIEALSNAMEAHERRKDAQVAHQWRLSLPAIELDTEQRSALTHEMSQALSDMYGVAVIAGIHDPDAAGDQRNFHAHLMFSTRTVEENGLGAKVTSITDRKTSAAEVTRFRKVAADLTNEALEDAGSDTRVSHLSYEARGIEKVPTTHLGPAASGMQRDGAGSDRGDINNAIIEERIAEQEKLSAAIARQFEAELPELSLATERELARRFGDEWQEVQPDDRAALPEAGDGTWQLENPAGDAHEAMQPELERVTATGTTHSTRAVHQWMQAQSKRFFEFLRDESGAPERAPSPPDIDPAADIETPPEAGEGRSWVSRVFDAGRAAFQGWQHRHEQEAAQPAPSLAGLVHAPPEESGGDEARPGGQVAPPEPDSGRPQERGDKAMSAFDALAASVDASALEAGSTAPSAFEAVTTTQPALPSAPSPLSETPASMPEL